MKPLLAAVGWLAAAGIGRATPALVCSNWGSGLFDPQMAAWPFASGRLFHIPRRGGNRSCGHWAGSSRLVRQSSQQVPPLLAQASRLHSRHTDRCPTGAIATGCIGVHLSRPPKSQLGKDGTICRSWLGGIRCIQSLVAPQGGWVRLTNSPTVTVQLHPGRRNTSTGIIIRSLDCTRDTYTSFGPKLQRTG
jgi:hypothetical protein